MNTTLNLVKQSSEALTKCFGIAPEIAVVLGSGLSDSIPGLDAMPHILFQGVPGFAVSKVPGHRSELRVGEIEGTGADGKLKTRRIAFVRGRNHMYEGHSVAQVVHNVRSLLQWGVKGIVLTNAAGSLNTQRKLGKFMLITDHINFTGCNPIEGHEIGFGPLFQDMTQCYNLQWQNCFKQTAERTGEILYEGIYFGVRGPSYETPAEIRMMQTLGAHAVGMSTVLESIAIRQMGGRVAGLSCLTNYGAGLVAGESLDHEHVVKVGLTGAESCARILLNSLVDLPVT